MFDAGLARAEGGLRDGTLLFEDTIGWFAAPSFRHRLDEPLRLANLAAPCGIRAITTEALDSAMIPWREVFVEGGVMAVAAAVEAGIAVSALCSRLAPRIAINVGPDLGLPSLPKSQAVIFTRLKDQKSLAAIRTLVAAFRGPARVHPERIEL